MNQAMNRNRLAVLDLEVDRGFAPLGQRLQTGSAEDAEDAVAHLRHTSRIAQASLRGQSVLVPPSSRHSTGTITLDNLHHLGHRDFSNT